MRLLNAESRQLCEFFGSEIPEYAILSHTWGKDEVSYRDIRKVPNHREKAGYAKINGCCVQAMRDDISWVWIDTCCIDKKSSAELSETINSMYRYYEESKVCYVYLADVGKRQQDGLGFWTEVRQSRWFTRGWTLQELLAPKRLAMFNQHWVLLDRCTYGPLFHLDTEWSVAITEATGISSDYFRPPRNPVTEATVAERLSWAARRETTRREDMAYCLLGLFQLNMPLLYGEGDRAFVRLQEEIIRTTNDHTILTWGLGYSPGSFISGHRLYKPDWQLQSPLVPSPDLFEDWGSSPALKTFLSADLPGKIQVLGRGFPYTMTNSGIQMELPLIWLDKANGVALAILNCGTHWNSANGSYVSLPLVFSVEAQGAVGLESFSIASRAHGILPFLVPHAIDQFAERTTLFLTESIAAYSWNYQPRPKGRSSDIFLHVAPLVSLGFYLTDFCPPHLFTDEIEDMIYNSVLLMRTDRCPGLLRFERPDGVSILLLVYTQVYSYSLNDPDALEVVGSFRKILPVFMGYILPIPCPRTRETQERFGHS
ncbi:heterokaryon incompatibility protein-domain-containing protein [Truncatella angustata]|uniref:Heterokaryon incompatibility protein-domain-containing protein n=1 Tax=Truncatella angustata TaxID=152316 RepID=A0A9P8ULB7_9PEZI|nr:heterokaryon incompatibility protein-domain-containing protein [Truncatella angustata]KAH6654281.1 heterokaryon incompatibility protein-domain-containing protein [Truncatella angustata]